MQRRKFSREFKLEAVKLVLGDDGPQTVVLRQTEPRRVCRRRWVVSHAAISRLSAAA